MTDCSVERIMRVVENDGSAAIKRTLSVAQSDIARILGEFMELTRLDVSAEKNGDGSYILTVKAGVVRFYDVGNTSDSE